MHSSSDGQKFETRRQTINARHGVKYVGLQKGIVAYSLVANHIPVNARIIGAHEHESHYVFDLLFNNTTTLRPDLHSTDTHGANEVNFALLHAFMYQFAPRYADIQEKVRTSLCGFQHPRQYADLTLRPIRKVNTELIIEEWDNILRILVSLAQKTTTQSIIVGKLSSYARRNKTQRALTEQDPAGANGTRPSGRYGNTTPSCAASICSTTWTPRPCASTSSTPSTAGRITISYAGRSPMRTSASCAFGVRRTSRSGTSAAAC